jgi:hypothetical protein
MPPSADDPGLCELETLNWWVAISQTLRTCPSPLDFLKKLARLLTSLASRPFSARGAATSTRTPRIGRKRSTALPCEREGALEKYSGQVCGVRRKLGSLPRTLDFLLCDLTGWSGHLPIPLNLTCRTHGEPLDKTTQIGTGTQDAKLAFCKRFASSICSSAWM